MQMQMQQRKKKRKRSKCHRHEEQDACHRLEVTPSHIAAETTTADLMNQSGSVNCDSVIVSVLLHGVNAKRSGERLALNQSVVPMTIEHRHSPTERTGARVQLDVVSQIRVVRLKSGRRSVGVQSLNVAAPKQKSSTAHYLGRTVGIRRIWTN
mmetsp:Transcript_26884/g.53638  ORF Transcript_26884/g.53638 Transcript_26884/m.53638 type:complete len:153 (+) Transcript_26884:12-470(+)